MNMRARLVFLSTYWARREGSGARESLVFDADHVFVLNDEDVPEDECDLLERLYAERRHAKTIALVAAPSALQERRRASTLRKKSDLPSFVEGCSLGELYWLPKSLREEEEGAELFRRAPPSPGGSFLGEKNGCVGDAWILKKFEPEERTSSDAFPLPYAVARRLLDVFCTKRDHVAMDLCGSLSAAAAETGRYHAFLADLEGSKAKAKRASEARTLRLEREAKKAESNKRKRAKKEAEAEEPGLPPLDPKRQYVLVPGQRTLTFARATSNQ